MKKLIAVSVVMSFSWCAHAIPVDGDSTYVYTSGDITRFIFDRPNDPANVDIFGNSEGLLFTNGAGLALTVTAGAPSSVNPSPVVIQDVPTNGGLGVDNRTAGESNSYGDNMGGGEWLTFTFNQYIDLLDINLNGIISQDGHQDSANGYFSYSTTGINVDDARAGDYDGTGGEVGSIVDVYAEFGGIDSFSISSTAFSVVDNWHGYVESIVVRKATVPEPSLLALLSIGLVGIGLTRRKA